MNDAPRKTHAWWRVAVLWAAAAGIFCAPGEWISEARGYLTDALAPGQTAARNLLDAGSRAAAYARAVFNGAADSTALTAERDKLRQENAALAEQLRAAQAQALVARATTRQADATQPLLNAQLIEARVLGQLARQHLAAVELLDAGADQQIEPQSLVVDLPVTEHLDLGTDASLAAEDLVLLGRRVLGRVEQVSAWTSAVRRITSPGYRDLVRLAHVDGNSVHFAAQGVLEGTGEALCRVGLVPVTEPVSVGDLVYTAASDGLAPAPLLYGRIVRAQREPGDAHWQLWLEPAVAGDPLDRVAVLRAATNPNRMTRTAQSTNHQ